VSKVFYDQIADALVGFLPPALRDFRSRSGFQTLKVWYGEEGAEHYEVQLIGKAALAAGGIRAARGPMLEIGFHAEHPEATANDAALQTLMRRERTWRKTLGHQPQPGPFAGHQKQWRRLSELWDEDGIGTEEAAIEAAERLASYIEAFEPLRARGEPLRARGEPLRAPRAKDETPRATKRPPG
jgi:hypothetical protein